MLYMFAQLFQHPELQIVSLEFTKSYGLYPSHDALQVPTLLGAVASVCVPLLTRTQHLQFGKMLRSFARSLRLLGYQYN